MSMDRFELQKLRDLPIEEVAERLGLLVTRHKCLCPFHDDHHASLSFSVARNTFRCWSCGASGDGIALTEKVLNVGFKEACQWLGPTLTLPAGRGLVAPNVQNFATNISTDSHSRLPPFREGGGGSSLDLEYLSSLVARPVLSAEARRFLFDERGYNPRVVEWLGVSSISVPTPCWRYGKPFYDAPSLLFPYRDIDGRVQNVQSRLLERSEDKPRFRFPRNSRIHVFNLPILRYLKEGEPLYVSEGVTDCIALLSSGKKAIAIPSATSLKEDDFSQLTAHHRSFNLHVYPDQDEPGERLYSNLHSLATRIGATLVRHDLPKGCKDYSEAWKRAACHPVVAD